LKELIYLHEIVARLLNLIVGASDHRSMINEMFVLTRITEGDMMGLAVCYVFLVVGIAVVCALGKMRANCVGVRTEICLPNRGDVGPRLLMSGGRSSDTGLRATSSRNNGLETSLAAAASNAANSDSVWWLCHVCVDCAL
jgi:hypothetical protein